MWSDLFKRWLDALFWWLPKDEPGKEKRGETQARTEPKNEASTEDQNREHGSEPVTSATASPPEPPASPQEPEPVPREASSAKEGDDLSEVKGIGPAMQDRLRAMGIASFADLAAVDADELTEKLKADRVVISRDRVQAWVSAARERT